MLTNISTAETPGQEQSKIPIIQNRHFVLFIVSAVIIVSFFGTITNSINVVVFLKTRSKDAINISLLGLAVSDFFICLTSMFVMLCVLPPISKLIFLRLHFHPTEAFYLSVGVSQTLFSRVTIYMTALIAFERCICVVMPLKVKTIITPNRVRFLVAFGYFLVALLAIPMYYINRLEWVYSPMLNRTLLRHVMTKDFQSVTAWYTLLDCFIFYIFLFLVIIVSTALLIINLNRKMAWREAATSSSTTSSNDVPTKEKKIAKMVVMISSIFTICYLPNIVLFMLVAFVPNFTILSGGLALALLQFIGTVNYLLAAINSSINTIIYYRNSSNYREVFDTIFHIKRQQIKK